MKRIALGGVVLAATMSTAAMAADLIVDQPVYEAATAAAYDWNGLYIGAQAGGGWATFDRETLPTPGFQNSYDASGWLAGIYAGANFQMDSFVLGIEGDVNWTNISGDDDGVGGTLDTGTINGLGSLRARAGVAMDSLLLYVTAGIAAGAVTADNDSGPESISNTHVGWTAGVGAELGVTEDIRVRAEYRYYDLGTQDYDFVSVDEAQYGITAHTVTVGLAFAF